MGVTVNPLLQMRKLRLADCQTILWLRIWSFHWFAGRIGYIVCWAQCKMRIEGPLLEN